MREIKFRAWLPAIKKMTYAHTLEELMHWNTSEWSDNTAEWLQFTGLKDKNGVEIYEGDIVHVIDISEHETLDYKSPVEWIDYSWILTEPNDTQTPLVCVDSSHDWVNTLTEIEVIGNIYETTPELLEATQA